MPRRGNLGVGDYELGKSRLCARMCPTCVYRPGNPVMRAGRLAEFEASAADRFIVYHSTYPPTGPECARPAICRGFYNRNRSTSSALLSIAAMWGFVEVEP